MGFAGRRRYAALVAAAAIVPAACATVPVTVTPQEIHRHVKDLRDTGQAAVEVQPSGVYPLSTNKVFEAGFRSGVKYLSVAQLISNCTEVVPYRGLGTHRNPPCLLEETTSEEWVVDTRTRADAGALKLAVGATLGLGLLGGLAYCEYQCGEEGKWVTLGVFVGGLLLITPFWFLFH